MKITEEADEFMSLKNKNEFGLVINKNFYEALKGFKPLKSMRTRRSRLIGDPPGSPAVISLGIGQSEHSSRSPQSAKHASIRVSTKSSGKLNEFMLVLPRDMSCTNKCFHFLSLPRAHRSNFVAS